MGFSILSLPEEIRSLSPSDLREVEDFTRDAIHLVLGGQFPKEAYETIGMNAAEIEKVKKVRKQAATRAATIRRCSASCSSARCIPRSSPTSRKWGC